MSPWRMPGVPASAPGGLRLLDRPGRAAVAAARQQKLLGFLFVDVMEWSPVLVIAPAEADQDLVAPRPHAMIGRPPREPALLSVDDDVPYDLGRLRRRSRPPTSKGPMPANRSHTLACATSSASLQPSEH